MRSFPAWLLCGSICCSLARADDRKFTYSYEAKTLPRGIWEFEQWATYQTAKDSGRWSTLLLREEFEYGVTDRLNGALYINTKYQANGGVDGFENEHSFGFESVSTEWKYKLTDPSTDLLGTLLYGELSAANDEYELETKAVLSKEIGPLTLAYNFVWESVLERSDEPEAGAEWAWEHEISNTAGASFAVTSSIGVGVEAFDIARFDRSLGGEHNHAYFAGPNVHYTAESWWATLTVVKQVNVSGLELGDDDNTKYAARLIVGVNF